MIGLFKSVRLVEFLRLQLVLFYEGAKTKSAFTRDQALQWLMQACAAVWECDLNGTFVSFVSDCLMD